MAETVLIYSSHNCCQYIHEQKIVQRALRGWKNKKILFLPISEMPHPDGNEFPSQHFGFNRFKWFFDQYMHYGLEVTPFYFSSHLKKDDVDLLIEYIRSYEVVFLGGGNPVQGMDRYRWIGNHFYGDPDLIKKLLHERQVNGLYTIGFSAGADQLCEYLSSAAFHQLDNPYGFGLAKNVMVTLHYESDRSEDVSTIARRFDSSLAFGLPNDSGIAITQGWLRSGNMFQIIEIILDLSWDVPQQQFHIKTRQGAKIEHFTCDGRHWAFNGGDLLVRVLYANSNAQEAWMVLEGNIIDYWTRQRTMFNSVQEILDSH